MSYAIDLNERQSARILEQALRHKASVYLEPRIFNEDESLRGQIEAILPSGESSLRPATMVIGLPPHADLAGASDTSQPPVTLAELRLLVGTCCDGFLMLGENRYLFDGDVLRIDPVHEPPFIARVFLTRPELLQVMQRRRYSRFRPGRSTQVELRWQKDNNDLGGAISWLCNISPDGMACRVERRIGEQLWIGDRITAEFTLAPGAQNHYVLDAVLCSKTPGGTEDKLILGLQFLTGPGYDTTTPAAQRLRQHLQSRLGTPANLSKGVDT